VSSTLVIILVVITVLVLALIAFLIIRRQRYIKSLRKRGWMIHPRTMEFLMAVQPPGSESRAASCASRWTSTTRS
jgi:hypothetical protein